jgi:hypothetical protein
VGGKTGDPGEFKAGYVPLERPALLDLVSEVGRLRYQRWSGRRVGLCTGMSIANSSVDMKLRIMRRLRAARLSTCLGALPHKGLRDTARQKLKAYRKKGGDGETRGCQYQEVSKY